MIDGAAKAAVILQGLSGHHLSGLLPGQHHKSAISAITAGMGGWSGHSGHGGVTRQGIETYATVADACSHTNPTTRITWAEVTEIIAKGCDGGRREAYTRQSRQLWGLDQPTAEQAAVAKGVPPWVGRAFEHVTGLIYARR